MFYSSKSSAQGFNIKIPVIVTEATLETCFNMTFGVPNTPENKCFTTMSTANVNFDALVYQHVVLHSFSHECIGLHIA